MACSERYSVSAFVAAWRWSFGRCDIFTGATATMAKGQTASRVLTFGGHGKLPKHVYTAMRFQKRNGREQARAHTLR